MRAAILISIAVSAYFHAVAISHLVAVELPHGDISARTDAKVAIPTPAIQTKSALVVLERNPFDSVTGSLTRVPEAEAEGTQELDLSDPLHAPRCADIRVYATAESSDPSWSSAVAQHKDAPRSETIRVGDALGRFEAVYIGHNRAEGSPAVWFVSDDELCQSLVFSDRPRFKSAFNVPAAPTKPAVVRKKKKPRKKRKKPVPPPLPRDLAHGIEKISSDEYRVDRGILSTLLEKGTDLLKRTRMVPVRENGRVTGMRISNIGKNTLLSKLGLKDGDRVDSINGFQMTNPEAALKAYSTVQRASDLSVNVLRKGKPMTLDIRIR